VAKSLKVGAFACEVRKDGDDEVAEILAKWLDVRSIDEGGVAG
jgi:hypothetical protein